MLKYDDFLLEKLKFEIFSLLEGHIHGTTEFLSKLKLLTKYEGSVGEIARTIFDIIDNNKWFPDSKIKQNYFDLVDSEDMVGFINHSKVSASEAEDNPDLPYSMPGRGEIKIGKIVNYVSALVNIRITDKQREEFVNAWKASTPNETIKFRLVSGKDIAKYYNYNNYYNQNAGALGGSCMKSENESFFNIYTQNPRKVKLLIYVDENDKVLGRALVWKVNKSPCESKYFMDRVYTNRDSDVNRFKEFANEKGWFYKKNMNCYDNVEFIYKGQPVAGEVKIKLSYTDFEEYPFVDTMCNLSNDMKTLSNLSDKHSYYLHSTCGSCRMCDDCEGEVIREYYRYGRGMEMRLCSECSDGHSRLKELGIETKWNKKVK